jgi:hypothetical protein
MYGEVERFLRRLVSAMQAGLGCSGCERIKLLESMAVRVASTPHRAITCDNLRLNQARVISEAGLIKLPRLQDSTGRGNYDGAHSPTFSDANPMMFLCSTSW